MVTVYTKSVISFECQINVELTIEQTLQQAITAHQAGQLEEAEALYRGILEVHPQHPDANHNLGVLAVSVNQTETALPLFKTALNASPTQGQFWLSYIDALIKTNQFESAKSVLNQGKQSGLAGEAVDVLEALLAQISASSAHQINLDQVRSPSQMEVNALLELYQAGQYDHAEHLAKTITQTYPDHPFAWKVLGVVFSQSGRLQESLILSQKSVQLSPTDAEAHSNLGNTLQELSRFEEAQTCYRKAITLSPDLPEPHNNLGITLQALGRLEEAETSCKKALVLKPEFAEAHNNLGNVLKEFGRLEEAEASYQKALALKPEFAEAHSNLSNTLQELGRFEEAEASCKKALAITPEYAEAHYNLGITLQALGRLEEAEASYQKALAYKPGYAEAHNNLGNVLKEFGRLEEAEASYQKALAYKPEFAEAYSNLGNILHELSRPEEALVAVIKSIKIKPIVDAKYLFNEVIKYINIQTWNQTLAKLLITALLEPWGRPSAIMPFACRLLKTDKEFVQLLNQLQDSNSYAHYAESLLNIISKKDLDFAIILQAMLSSSPIPDDEIEILLTLLRHYLLTVAGSKILKKGPTENIAPLYCSLAQQCFINEYAYSQTSEEINHSQQLSAQLTKAIEEGQSIPAVWIIALACYFPLHSIAGVEKLLHQNWSDEVKNVLIQQIQEPLEEVNLRQSIPVLTNIDNQVSLAVQNQYEINPYPRWVRLSEESNKTFLNSYIQSRFSLSNFKRLDDDRSPAILIAGCGTGQHLIELSQSIIGENILAVDLSMASLAYAKRKTIELGIESIEFAQADLLKLRSLGRTFDVIESSGVLHHLDKPFEGWEVLLSLLRPHGLMKLGFYSELARRDIVRVRNLISQEGIGSSYQEIRNFRKYLLELKDSEDYGFATNSLDFFSLSTCRDLLFHVQEHRMTLPVLAKFLQEHNLNFLGFDINSSVKHSYKSRFPNDLSETNLNNWHIYEEEYPNTFLGMYQFWIQKA
jgi:tetratricopeptide (TPR) repeat protein/2-polyprenyl-3-methyl-5-hydroxy-6-metoxy-1,4-benzoquinol methylase